MQKCMRSKSRESIRQAKRSLKETSVQRDFQGITIDDTEEEGNRGSQKKNESVS